MDDWLNMPPAEAASKPDSNAKPAGSEPAAAPAAGNPGTPPAAAGPKDTAPPPDPAAEVRYELKSPDGSPLQGPALEALVKVSKEHKVSPEVAQKLLDEVSPVLRDTVAKQLADAHAAQRAMWAEQSRKHPEIGGERLPGTIQAVNRLLSRYAPQELREALASGLQYQPGFLVLMSRIAADLSEDGSKRREPAPQIQGQAPAVGERTLQQIASVLYA